MTAVVKAQTSSVLFVDDDEASTLALIRSLQRNGASFTCYNATNAADGLSLVRKFAPQVLVLDLSLNERLGPDAGLNAIAEFHTIDPTLRILVLTGHSAEQFGVRALQQGAASFIAKPVNVEHLLALIRDALNCADLRRKFAKLTTDATRLHALTGLQSKNAKMQSVIEAVAFAATTSQPVLIVGETGTGKGVIARAIHSASKASAGPFIRYQGTFAGQDLVSSELFGHKRGAFTGANEDRRGLIESAHKGILFIDEIDELPAETQVLLLNVLQEKTFRPLGSNKEQSSDFRLLAATNRDVSETLKSNKLRQDLYHRIAHMTIEIPPLRERKEDISQLAQDCLQQIVSRQRLPVCNLSAEALAKLNSHSWPGNVRELQAVVEGAVFLANYREHSFVEAMDVNLKPAAKHNSVNATALREKVKGLEEELAREALRHCDNNQTKAAKHLGLDRTSFRRILARVNLL